MTGLLMTTLRLLRDERAMTLEEVESIERTLESLLPSVRRWLHRALGPRPDLDDATQDALFQIAKSLDSFEGASALETWAYRITTRVAYRYLRRRYSTVQGDTDECDELPANDASPETRALHRESVVRFRRCLDRLSPKRRMAFLLCAVERLPHAQAAEIESTSVETMRARLKRARADLREHMKQDPVLAPLVAEVADE